jgi:hypothetical protein
LIPSLLLILKCLCWVWSKSPEWWVAFGTILLALITFLLAVVTVFQDSLRTRYFRPRLRIKAKSERPCAEKNRRQNGVDVYCFRLEVVNEGNVEGRDVQVYLAELKYKNAAAHYISVEKFSPMRIVWAHYHTRTLDVLLPGMPWFCDFFHISDPGKKSVTGEDVPGSASTDPVVALDLEVPDLMVLRFLPKGEYRATLRVGASNHAPTDFKVKISFRGLWLEDENLMFQESVGIEMR